MKIRVLIERDGKEKNVKLKSGSVGSLLDSLDINPESVIIARGKDLLTERHKLEDGEKIRIIHIKASE